MRESGFDPSKSVRAVQRRHHPLLTGVLERPCCCGWRRRHGTHRRDPSTIAKAVKTWQTRARGRRHLSIDILGECRRRPVLRLQLPDRKASPLRVRDDVLSALGGQRVTAAGARRPQEPVAIRSARRIAHEHAGHRQPVGRTLRLGLCCRSLPLTGCGRYGFQQEADRLARKFVSLVVEDFDAHGTIVERNYVRRRSSDLAQGLRFGTARTRLVFGVDQCRRSGAHGGTRLPPPVEGAWRSGPLRWPIRRRGVCRFPRHRLRSGYPSSPTSGSTAPSRPRRRALSAPAPAPAPRRPFRQCGRSCARGPRAARRPDRPRCAPAR